MVSSIMRVLPPASVLLLSIALAHCGGEPARPPLVVPPPAAASASAVAPDVAPPPTPLAPSGPIVPPMTLTATDGTGLRLMKLVARAVVDDPLAFTELTLTFENPSERTLEGTFAITLPQGAAVSRFAMKLDGGWQEGEVVELEEARRAYEDFLHRKQDPALLEQAAGNQFSARVFPIPARGQKEVVISYSQEITADAPFAVPLRGLPEIGEVDIELGVAGQAAPVAALKQRSYTPTGDVGMRTARRAGVRSGNLVLARVQPATTPQPDPLASTLVLVDTSASRALGFEAELKTVAELAKLVARTAGAKLTVACFDQTTDAIFSADAAAFGDEQIAKIRARGALGASDLGKALAWARANAQGMKRVLVVGDGVATAGPTEASELRAAAIALKDAGVERLDVVAIGGIRDDATLKRLATAGLARDGVVVDAAADAAVVTRRLGEATRSGIDVKVEGAAFVWPQRLDGVQSGDEALVYADVPAGTPVRVALGGAPAIAIDVATVDRPLLERSWVKAKIASLLDKQGADEKEETKKEIVRLSVASRVLSPYTALLVLETDEDYDRFKIDRRALVDVMTIERGKVALTKRSGVHRPAPMPVATAVAPEPPTAGPSPSASAAHVDAPRTATPARPSPAPQSAASVASPPPPSPDGDAKPSGLGLSGVGEGGGGSGSGIGLGSGHGRLGSAHRVQAPTIRQGATSVSGRLPPEVIQRIVRQNFGRFRLCYETGLRQSPRLQGRVSVRFVIDRSGAVANASDAGSDLPSPAVIQCVVRSFAGLSFPQPEGGVVTVVYPILFAPGETHPGSPSVPPSGNAPDGDHPAEANPYDGRFKGVMDALAKKDVAAALADATKWRAESPGDVLAIVALGEALEASKDAARAARAYGSLIDLFPARADMRRFAGVRLERVTGAIDLAFDSFAKAAAQRPDHPSSHRLLAYALLKRGAHAKAFDAIVKGAARAYPEDRFPGVDRILHEDIGLIAAAWIKAEPARRAEILARVKEARGIVEDAPSIRFVLTWETDANDVDFHIYDSKGGHAYYQQMKLPSGGELYADVTTGYGPECFTIRLPPGKRATYTLQANYYSRGPMGYGMGKLEVIDHDGRGGLTFEEHPYVVMIDQAYVDLGVVKR